MIDVDFGLVLTYRVSMDQFIQEWDPTTAELARQTDASVDGFLTLLRDLSDDDLIRVPHDPEARDDAAVDPGDRAIAWTIAHNIVHATASGEEYAAVATELARGIEFHGRPRYETPWQSITTVGQARQRLEESRRIRLASLQMWPDLPDLRKGYTPWKASGWINAQGIFTWGLVHDQGHRLQIAKILRQGWSEYAPVAGDLVAAGQMF